MKAQYTYKANKVVCFDKEDEHCDNKQIRKNFAKNKKQLEKRGFSDSELWNLDYSAAAFLYPRLKRFKKITHGYPASLTEKEWDEILDKILYSLKSTLEDDFVIEEKPQLKINEGFELLGKYFQSLWD